MNNQTEKVTIIKFSLDNVIGEFVLDWDLPTRRPHVELIEIPSCLIVFGAITEVGSQYVKCNFATPFTGKLIVTY